MTSITTARLDGLSSSTAIKGPCRAATTANIVLTGEQTIDGVAIVTGDRVLVRSQTTATDNGIYIADTGVWRRSADFAKTRDVMNGTIVQVANGTVGAGLYELTTPDPVNVGTVNVTFSPFTGAPAADQRNYLDVPVYVTTRAALKALDTTKDTVAIFDGNLWYWTLGNYTAEVAADDQEGVTIKATAIAASVGAWVRQFQQPVSATAFGAFTGTALQEACDYMYRKGGGEVYLPSGSTNVLSAFVTIPYLVNLRGGKGSAIQPGASMTKMLYIATGLTAIEGIRIENASSYATRGIEVNKAGDNLPVKIRNNYIALFTEALHWTDGDCLTFADNMVNSNGSAVVVANDARNARFNNNYVLGGNGYLFNKGAQGVEGAIIHGDCILPGAGGGYCVALNTALDVTMSDCIFDQVYGAAAVSIDASTNSINNVKLIGNWFGRNLTASGANYGLYVFHQARSVLSIGNTYAGWQQAGIYFNGEAAGIAKDCQSVNDVFYWADRCLRDIQIEYNQGALISGATFSGSGASIVENAGVTGRVVECNYSDSVLPSSIALGLRYGQQRSGMTLQAKGTATLAQTTKVATITHGLSYTPTRGDINIQANGNPVNAPGEFTADTIGATTFRGVCRNDPGLGGAPVVWEANLTR